MDLAHGASFYQIIFGDFWQNRLFKKFLVMPSGETNLSHEHLEMIQIDCLVTGTKPIALSRPIDHVEQDDDEVKVEIEI